MIRIVQFSSTAAVLLACLIPPAGRASTISLPTASYVDGTNLVTFADPDEAIINSISDGLVTIGFSTPMRASTVGDDWSSWGAPPNTESSTPRVLWSGLDDNFDPITTETFSLSRPVSTFGFEAQPDPTDVHTMTANFFLGGQLEQTISLDVSGDAGALLFAAIAPPGTFFDSVTLTSDVDWAAGQFRYAPFAQTVPEPGTWGVTSAGLLIMFAVLRKRSRISN